MSVSEPVARAPRPDQRQPGELRPTRLTAHWAMHAEGSVLVEAGHTKVLCTASIEDRVPPFLRGTGKGWVTSEYGMLPRATSTRTTRESLERARRRTNAGDSTPYWPVAASRDRSERTGRTDRLDRL